jgi:catechol 2,3-dioxygenase-like lactoylglutathione lyase family enzyme
MSRRDPLGRVVSRPILAVADMEAAIDFYRRLGLDVASFDQRYAWVRHRGDEVLHLRLVDGFDPATNSGSAYLHVRDVDLWWEAMTALGVEIERPDDMPWGMREFAVTDPSGNLVRVGSNR